ncbi:MAG: YfhO family protein [Flexibacteraceae bacterium]
MRKIDFKTQVLPHLIVVALFYAIVFLYFSDALGGGKVIRQSDSIQWAGASSAVYEHRAQYGEEPLWTNSMFGGMPTYTVSTIFTGDVLDIFDKILMGGFPYPISIVFLSLVCYYITLLCFNVKPYVAAVGAIAFTFFSFNFISLEAGHNSKLRAMVYAPLILGSINLLMNKKWLWGFVLASLSIAMQIKSGHYQITYYTAFIVAIMAVSELVFAIKEKKFSVVFKTAGFLILATIIGFGANVGRLWTLNEYTQYSMRGKAELTPKDKSMPTDGGLNRDYVFDWSHEQMEVFTLLIPSIYGGSSSEKYDKNSNVAKVLKAQGVDESQLPAVPYYWGSMPFTSGPIYAGAVVILLFVVGLFIVDNRYRWWLLTAALLGILLSMGKHLPSLNYTLYDVFPYYNKFRTVAMAIFIAQVTMPLLGALALNKLMDSEIDKELQKKLTIAAGIVAAVTVLFFLIPDIAGDFTAEENDARLATQGFPEWLISAVGEDRVDLVKSDAIRSFFYILMAFGAIYAMKFKAIPRVALVGILGLLTLSDLWAVDRRYLNKESFQKKSDWENNVSKDAADEFIKKDTDPHYRVLNLQNPFAETKTSAFHHSLGGYSPAKVRRYQDLIENNLTVEIQQLTQMINSRQFTMDSLQKLEIINMLNTRYIKLGDTPDAVIKNPYARGNAWFVKDIKAVTSPDEEILAINQIDVLSEATVDTKKFPAVKESVFTIDSAATIKLTQYKLNDMVYESNNPNPGLAVFSDIYYPAGWEVTVDDKPADYIRANYILRGLQLPAGKHTIRFQFRPQSYYLGNKIMMASGSMIILMFLIASVVTLRKPKE